MKKHPTDRDLPAWSAYLDDLHEQVEQQVERRQAHGAHHPPLGERRAKPAEAPVTKTSFWSDYLIVLRSGMSRTARNILSKLVPVSSAAGEEEHRHHRPGHPVGNRRTGIESFAARATLGHWNFYFIVKLGLYWAELMDFHPLVNLLFAIFIGWPADSPVWRRWKNVLTGVLALSLLYYDSWLPSPGRILSQAPLLSEFSFSYLIELISRFISPPLIAAIFSVWVVYWLVSRWLRVGTLVMLGLLVLVVLKSTLTIDFTHKFKGGDKGGAPLVAAVKPDIDQVVQDFFDRESQRSVSFSPPASTDVPFDVIFLHVCSLSWSDVVEAGLEQHPLWKRFDILLNRFNSVSSYSGPAALHLLRATCGQPRHEKMYVQTAEKCYLMNSLHESGFTPEFAMNHNGKFDDFLGQIREFGRLTAPPLSLAGLPAAQYGFDNAAIYDDFSVLNRWLVTRNKSDQTRVALYYNTTSLHDGNHLPGTHSQPNTLKTYRERLFKLLNNMDNFMMEVERSGRRAVVVMVPEHGAELSGDKRQIAGLREIPTPAITLVPVGIKVIGGHAQRDGERLLVDQPTSYLAISHIVARMLEKSPYTRERFSPADYLADLPVTPFVAQNEKSEVVEYNHRYYLNRGLDEWEEYAEFDPQENKR